MTTADRLEILPGKRRNASRAVAQVDDQEVARLASAFYGQRGCREGCDVEDWLRAEAIVRSRKNGQKQGDRDHGRRDPLRVCW